MKHSETVLYDKFEEVEQHLKRIAPSVVYKYRADWNFVKHREFITKQIMWFSAPRDLNDPYDIRTQLRFDFSQLDRPEFLHKIENYYKITHQGIAFSERDLRIICERILIQIKEDPRSYFEEKYRDIRDSEFLTLLVYLVLPLILLMNKCG